MKKQISVASIVVAVASAIGIIATFLPWITTSILGTTISARGTDGDGWITLILFIAVLGMVIYSMFKEAKWAKICITIAAALALLDGIIIMINALSNGFTASIGVYLVIIAGIVCAAMPWIPIQKSRHS